MIPAIVAGGAASVMRSASWASSLTSAPVSTRYCTLVFFSVTGNRRLVGRPETLVAGSGRPDRFPDMAHGGRHFLAASPKRVWYQQIVRSFGDGDRRGDEGR